MYMHGMFGEDFFRKDPGKKDPEKPPFQWWGQEAGTGPQAGRGSGECGGAELSGPAPSHPSPYSSRSLCATSGSGVRSDPPMQPLKASGPPPALVDRRELGCL